MSLKNPLAVDSNFHFKNSPRRFWMPSTLLRINPGFQFSSCFSYLSSFCNLIDFPAFRSRSLAYAINFNFSWSDFLIAISHEVFWLRAWWISRWCYLSKSSSLSFSDYIYVFSSTWRMIWEERALSRMLWRSSSCSRTSFSYYLTSCFISFN